MPMIVAVANPKGGTGKSTVSANIAAVAAMRGRKTMLIDLDPQGSSSLLSGIEAAEDRQSAGAMFSDDPMLPSQLAISTRWSYEVVPAGAGLIETEDWLARHVVGQHQLRLLFKRDTALADYDFIVVDTTGFKGRLLNAALLAASNVVIPIRPSVLSTNELPDFLAIIAKINLLREGLGDARLLVNGVVFNMVKEGTNAAAMNIAEVNEALTLTASDFGCAACVLPDGTAVEEAAREHAPVVVMRPLAKVAQRYNELFDELFGNGGRASE
jgi:chromosome partitioning protein